MLIWQKTDDGWECLRTYQCWDDRGRVVGHRFTVELMKDGTYKANSSTTRNGENFGPVQSGSYFDNEVEAKSFMETRVQVLEKSVYRKKSFSHSRGSVPNRASVVHR